MAYVNNGTERSLKVSVYKKVGGNYVQGYPKVYDGQQSWGDPSYPTLTDIEFRQLSDAAFSARLSAFEEYVESIESGADFATDVIGDGAVRSNTGVCLPTTTTTQRPVWSFSVKYSTVSTGACNGISDTLYSYTQFPSVGDVLYQDSAMTTPWTKGAYILFVNPGIYGNITVMVSVITNSSYDAGEIINTTTGYNCNVIPTTTTQVQSGTLTLEVEYVGGNDTTDAFTGSYSIDGASRTIDGYQKYIQEQVSQIFGNHTIDFSNMIYRENGDSSVYYIDYKIGTSGSWNSLSGKIINYVVNSAETEIFVRGYVISPEV